MILNSYTGNHYRVIELGQEALKHLGFSLHTQRLKLQLAKEILHGKFLFRDSRLEAIKNAPQVTDEKLAGALEILTIMAASANFVDENFFSLIVLKIGNLSAKYGNSPYSSLGYAAYSIMLDNVLGDYAKGKQLQNIALSLAEQFDEEQFATITYFCIGSYVAHWTAPAQESFAYLQKAFDCAIGSGDYLYSCYSLMIMLEMKHSMGVSLAELEELLNLPDKYPQELSNELLQRSITMFKEHIRLLSMPDPASKQKLIEEQEMEELNTNEVMIYNLLKIQRLLLEDRLDEAYRLLQKYIKNLDSIRGYINQVDWVFYYLLVSLKRIKKQEGSSFSSGNRIFQQYRKKLLAWVKLSPANHWGKHLLIEALNQDLNNRQQAAVKLYEAAIEHAQQNNHLLL